MLMCRVVEHHERIKVLIDKFSASFVDGSTAALQPTLLELSRMTAPQAQSIQLTQLAAQIEPLANAWRRALQANDFNEAVELYEKLPEYLRDSKTHQRSISQSAIDRRGLRHRFEIPCYSKRFIGLGPAIEEYSCARPGEPEFTALEEIVSVNEAAMSLIPFKGTERRALAQLERGWLIPIEMRDSEICGVITELPSRIQSRLKKVKRFLLWQFILAFIIGTALGVAMDRFPRESAAELS